MASAYNTFIDFIWRVVFVGLQARKSAIDYREQSAELTNRAQELGKIYYQLLLRMSKYAWLSKYFQGWYHWTIAALYKTAFAESLDIDRASIQLAKFPGTKSSHRKTIFQWLS